MLAEDAEALKEWIEPTVKAVKAGILVSDDAHGLKPVARDLGQAHQVCKSHVKRNTETLVGNAEPKVTSDEDGYLSNLTDHGG